MEEYTQKNVEVSKIDEEQFPKQFQESNKAALLLDSTKLLETKYFSVLLVSLIVNTLKKLLKVLYYSTLEGGIQNTNLHMYTRLQLLLHVCTKTFDDNGLKARLEKRIMLLTKASEENTRRERVSAIFRVFFVLIDGTFCRHFKEDPMWWQQMNKKNKLAPFVTTIYDWGVRRLGRHRQNNPAQAAVAIRQ